MNDGLPSPERHARGWRLALTLGDAPPARATVELDGRRLLLLARAGGGWWALEDRCRVCGMTLSASPAARGDELACLACGTRHGPGREDTSQLPVMLVDDEVYVLLED